MKCDMVEFSINNGIIKRIDYQFKFYSIFDMRTGLYKRSGIVVDGKETNEDPFMASFPHLIDVGIMGHCIHGTKGLCVKAGIQCYQNGLNKYNKNMSLDNFEKIVSESQGLIDQIALGGRGDPDCHENFEDILKLCRKYHITPNYTTSGLLFNKKKAELSKKYCGAVAVSWYRSDYTLKAINLLVEEKVKTNIHFVVDKNSIDEAIELLHNDSFPKGINAVIFLLFKPIGQGERENMLLNNDSRIKQFFDVVSRPHPYKIGFDSCFVPGIINNMQSVDFNTLDTCEGARFSMYISSDMVALPCSFDQEKKYAFDITNKNIYDAWISKQFDDFRFKLKHKCSNCKKRSNCFGGCPLVKDIVLCNRLERGD